MSHHIDYDRKVFKIEPFEFFDHCENKLSDLDKRCKHDFFIVTTLGGDNNLCDENNKHRRDWYILTANFSEWKTMRRIVEISSDCEGGCLKLAKHKHTHAENYIRAYRNAVKNAIQIPFDKRLGIWRFPVINSKILDQCPCKETKIRVIKHMTESQDYKAVSWFENEIQYYLEVVTPVKLAEALTIKQLPDRYNHMR